MREVAPPSETSRSPTSSLAACLATILEIPIADVPEADSGEDLPGYRPMRWLDGLGMGLAPVADAAEFSWAGPWIGLVRPSGGGEPRAVVMYGVPSGVVWDPTGVTGEDGWELEGGFVVSAVDVALARPPLPDTPAGAGTVDGISRRPARARPPSASTRCARSRGSASMAIVTPPATARSPPACPAAPSP